jgi:hypothetical protein
MRSTNYSRTYRDSQRDHNTNTQTFDATPAELPFSNWDPSKPTNDINAMQKSHALRYGNLVKSRNLIPPFRDVAIVAKAKKAGVRHKCDHDFLQR